MPNKDKKIIIFIAMIIVRIPLSHIIGDNGVGYLMGPIELFWIAYLLFGSGLISTMSGMMRERIRRGQIRNAGLVFSVGKRYTLIISAILIFLCAIFFVLLNPTALLDTGSRLAALCIGPALVLGILINLHIGYLSGTDNIKASILGESVFAAAILIFMPLGGKLGVNYGAKIAALLINEEVTAIYGALGAMIGLCVSELIALISLIVMTFIYQRTFTHLVRTDNSRKNEYMSDINSSFIGGIIIDGCLGALIQLPIFVLLTIYRKHGIKLEETDTAAMIGAFYGKYLVVVGLLSAFAVYPVANSFKGILTAINDSDDQLAGDRISRMLGRILYFTVPAAVFSTMLVNPIVATFFTGRVTTITNIISIGCAVIVLYPIMYAIMSVLLRLGYSREMVFVCALSLIISSVLGIFFVYKGSMELKGIVIILMINYAFVIVFCSVILFRNIKIRLRLLQQLIIPFVISGVIGILVKLLSGAILEPLGGILTLVICLIPSWLIYNIACMFLHVVSPAAMDRKLFGRLMVKLGTNLGFY